MNKNFIFIGGVAILVVIIALTSIDKVEEPSEILSVETDTQIDTHDHETDESMHIDHHLHEAEVSISTDGFMAEMNALGMIPLENESGAVGYGVITDKGTDAVVVSTTHAGVLDSELQSDASDPVWHNHVVKLGEVALCGEDPGVVDISFESPGEVEVEDGQLVMVDVPATFEGTHSLNQSSLTFNHGTDVKSVVEFELSPKFSEQDELQAVCVTNINEVAYNII